MAAVEQWYLDWLREKLEFAYQALSVLSGVPVEDIKTGPHADAWRRVCQDARARAMDEWEAVVTANQTGEFDWLSACLRALRGRKRWPEPRKENN